MSSAIPVLLLLSINFANSFNIYWNAPSDNCGRQFKEDLQLEKYGIISNENQTFYGNNIVIFYEKFLGLYPYINSEGVAMNGGIPQKSDLSKHEKEIRLSLSKLMPDVNYRGLAIIDWEKWYPVWDLNYGARNVYREASIKYAKTRHPTAGSQRIMKLAKKDFQFSAKIRWLYDWSKGLYPSIYIKQWILKYTQTQKEQFIQSRILEAQKYSSRMGTGGSRSRVTNQASRSIYPYSTFTYGNNSTELEFYSKMDLCASLRQAADLGTTGVILWGSSFMFRTKDRCSHISKYIDQDLGPAIQSITDIKYKCSKDVCSGHGECCQVPQKSCHIADPYSNNATCKCFTNWKGKKCNKIDQRVI